MAIMVKIPRIAVGRVRTVSHQYYIQRIIDDVGYNIPSHPKYHSRGFG